MASRIIRPLTAYRHLRRLTQIVNVFVKYGFGDLLSRARIWEYANIERRLLRRRAERLIRRSTPERLRLALEELGPAFIKLGQVLSTRPDLLPPDFIEELEKLQGNVAPVSVAAARQVVETELGHPISELFAEFEDQPVASASLAQVHRARLKTGQVAALKIQRPHVERIVRADLDILHDVAALAERYLQMETGVVNLVGLVEELSLNIRQELDFRAEAANLRRFAANFAGDLTLRVPRVYSEYSTRRLLTMEFISGISIADTARLKAEGYDLPLIARRGVDIALKSILEHGFFHADPHPGNIFILPGNVIALVDFGMMGTVTSHEIYNIAMLVDGIINRNERGAARAMLALVERRGQVREEELEADVAYFIQRYTYLPAADLDFGETLVELFRMMRTHHLQFREHLVWLLKGIINVEATGRRLDPAFDMADYVRPYARKLLQIRFNPLYRLREFRYTIMDAAEFLRDLPYEARAILRQVREGRIRVELEHLGLEPLRVTLKRVANRIALAIILAALLVGSSLLVSSGLPPLVAGIPIIGLIGYVFAGVLAVGLALSILFSRY